MGGELARVWERRNAYRVLVGSLKGRDQLARYGHRWGDNKILLKETMGERGVDSSGSVERPVAES
jgi:hypothetical protein